MLELGSGLGSGLDTHRVMKFLGMKRFGYEMAEIIFIYLFNMKFVQQDTVKYDKKKKNRKSKIKHTQPKYTNIL